MDDRAHWERVWGRRSHDEVSWFQAEPTISLDLISRATDDRASVVDIGGGASTLVDALLDHGYTDLTVVDIADTAVQTARRRLGRRGANVDWIVGDVLEMDFARSYDLWHDRAFLHFLIDPDHIDRYLHQLRSALSPEGGVVIATFGPDGPETCSGLPVRRYGFDDLATTLGPDFEAIHQVSESHRTPSGDVQQFNYGLFRRRGDGGRTG